MNKLFFLTNSLFVAVLFTACTSQSEQDTLNISGNLEYNATSFNKVDPNTIKIIEVNLHNNFLTIKFSAAGCDGESWKLRLLGTSAKDFLESLPPQRNIRLSLESEERCERIIEKVVTFDITNAQDYSYKHFNLNLQNWDEQIQYKY